MQGQKNSLGLILTKIHEIEANKESFYRILEKKTESEELKMIFSRLAGEEATHMKDIENLKSANISLSLEVPVEDLMFLQNLMDQFLIFDASDAIQKAGIIKAPSQIIDLAINLEIKAVCLYMELMNLTHEDAIKSFAREMALQEKQHMNILSGLRTSLWETV